MLITTLPPLASTAPRVSFYIDDGCVNLVTRSGDHQIFYTNDGLRAIAQLRLKGEITDEQRCAFSWFVRQKMYLLKCGASQYWSDSAVSAGMLRDGLKRNLV